MVLSQKKIQTFQHLIWEFYHQHQRPMPFRHTDNPYWVLISEIMLQQTQVSTVLNKFPIFIQQFPSFSALAQADLATILQSWQGLGYNRRAKFLHLTAQRVMADFEGLLPLDPEWLITFPGIGKATAASIYVFATNKPFAFIETNIRRIYIHHFFPNETEVTDARILPLVEATMDRDKPRDWFYALMDYGTYLAKTVPNPNRKSKQYAKQSTFEGSSRQVRGQILKYLLMQPQATALQIKNHISGNITFFDKAIQELEQEKMIELKSKKYSIKKGNYG